MDLPSLKMDSPKAKESDLIHTNLLSVQLDSIKTTTKEFWKALQGNLLTNLLLIYSLIYLICSGGSNYGLGTGTLLPADR